MRVRIHIFWCHEQNLKFSIWLYLAGYHASGRQRTQDIGRVEKSKNALSDDIKTQRFQIPDNEVSFENAWGICDEDLYKQSIKYADRNSKAGKPFFQFVMTTSNHKPYIFPNGKINLPQGNRNAAVKYTDYALGKFLSEAKTKPWFKYRSSSSLPIIVRIVRASGNSRNVERKCFYSNWWQKKNETVRLRFLQAFTECWITNIGLVYSPWSEIWDFVHRNGILALPDDQQSFRRKKRKFANDNHAFLSK